MKKYISLLSLTALMVSNNAYTIGKPLTAQEKIRVNTLLVRQKNLNMDIDRLKSQNKNVPATKTKDLNNVTNAINTYELRDPEAVAQIKKGFTTAAKTPTQSTAKPKKPSAQPASSGTLQPVKKAPAVSGSSLTPQSSPVVQTNPLYDNIPNEPKPLPTPPVHQPINMQPVQPSLPIKEKESAIEELKLLNKKNQLDSTVLNIYEVKITNLPQEEKQEAIYEVLRKLQKEFDQNNYLTADTKITIANTVQNRLNPLLITDKKPAQEAKKPEPLYPVINKPEAPKWLDGNKLNEATLQQHMNHIKSLPSDPEKENAFNNIMVEVYEEFRKSPLNQELYSGGLNDIYDKIRNDLQSLFTRTRSPLSDDLGESVSINPSKKQQLKSKKPAVAPVEQNIQVMQWTNLKKYLTTRDDMLDIKDNENKLVSSTWLKNILTKAQEDKPTLSQNDIPAIIEETRKGLKPFLTTQMESNDTHFSAQINSQSAENNIIQELEDYLNKNINSAQPKSVAATGMPLFTNSQPNMPAILAAAKATKANKPKDAMNQMKITLSESDRATWNANEQEIKNFLEQKWGNQ